MAQTVITNATDTTYSGAMQQEHTNSVDAQNNAVDGKYLHGDRKETKGGADTDIARKLSDGLIKTPFDDTVVVAGFSGAYINAMSREFGSRQIKSMRYGYYSIGLRKVSDTLAVAATGITKKHFDKNIPVRYEITVTDAAAFDETDEITFTGIQGYDAHGDELPMVDLAARVCATDAANNKLTVQFLNGKVNLDTAASVTIPANTVIYILGHAASEADAKTTPYAALPERKEQFMQKFMVQSLISRVMEESTKEVKWGESEINDLLMQQFVEDIEKAYIKGVKSYTFDKVTNLWTYTTSGVIEQLVEGGGTVITVKKNEFNKEKILDIMTEIFVGNNGSEKRYMMTGINFSKAFFGLKDVKDWIDANSVERKFEYDWTRLRFFNYLVYNAPDPLFDKIGMRDYALVLDRQYVERRYFFSMDDTDLELKKTGAYDGKSTVWSEISSVILKYPQCHALIKLEDDAPSSSAE